jgi:hypothetical protein
MGRRQTNLEKHVDAAKKGTVVRIGPPNVLSDKVIEEATASQLLNDLRKDSLTKGDSVVAIRNLIVAQNPSRYINSQPDRKTVMKVKAKIIPNTKKNASVQATDRKKRSNYMHVPCTTLLLLLSFYGLCTDSSMAHHLQG